METEDRIRRLARLLRECELSEIEIEEDGQRLKLVAAPVAPTAPVVVAPPVAAPEIPSPKGDGTVEFTSPFVGTFFRAPSPHSPPFVEEGDHVRRGRVLCIIEAMKVMNEI